MEVLERRENKLLDRVEIDFRVNHDGQATPSRDTLIDLLVKAEPGCKKEFVIMKKVNSRFGKALTTGVAHIYSSDAGMQVEAKYLLLKHGIGVETEEVEASSKDVSNADDESGEE